MEIPTIRALQLYKVRTSMFPESNGITRYGFKSVSLFCWGEDLASICQISLRFATPVSSLVQPQDVWMSMVCLTSGIIWLAWRLVK